MNSENIFDSIKKGVDFLRKKYDEDELRKGIEKGWDYIISRYGNVLHKDLYDPESYIKRRKNERDITDILPNYVLNLLNDGIDDNLRKFLETDEFWFDNDDLVPGTGGNFYIWNFLFEMGFSSNTHFMEFLNEIKGNITERGSFWDDDSHNIFLRVLIGIDPQGFITKRVLNYSLQERHQTCKSYISANFILALSELNYKEYKEIIDEGIRSMKDKQNDNGSWGDQYNIYRDTYFVIRTICRINGKNDESLKKGIEFILQTQEPEGNWGDNTSTSFALMSLVLVSPAPISLEEYLFKDILFKQNKNLYKPYFIHTSPIYHKKSHVKTIHDKIRDGFNNVKCTIRIISPYIDILYEDIIDLKNNDSSLIIKIITRPRKDIGEERKRISLNALNLLNIATKGNLRILDTIHSRLIIIDEKELIISSAVMSRDGLFDEFNAGIYTNDDDTIRNAIEYFENVWQESLSLPEEKTKK